ncbi:hypothetical protein Q1695_002290 [Nippostrongylus brasiliensis]|nr:hypothetical protein Q1695_002290 [Nippostrongylus brasiliensis]
MVSNPDGSTAIAEQSSYGGAESHSKLINGTKNEETTVFTTGNDASRFTMISLERNSQGLGFNIVGGKDSQHIPGHSGIFVSVIKSGSPAYSDGRLSVGDMILSVNGVDLVNKTHDEAVSIFRAQNHPVVDLLVEIGAENRILNEKLSADTHIAAGKSPNDDDIDLVSGLATPLLRKSYGDVRSTPSPSNADDLKGHDDDSESVTSGAPSVHSFLDDVPRTPKRPMSYLDPRNPSLVTEVLYVSIGLSVISLGVFIAYRIIRSRR